MGSLKSIRLRSIVYQALLAAALVLAAWYLIANAVENLGQRRIASGFAFLARESGFEIGESTFLSYNAADTYLRAIAVGFLNTFRVAALAIVFSTLLGTLIGLARLSPNWLLAKLAAVYVEGHSQFALGGSTVFLVRPHHRKTSRAGRGAEPSARCFLEQPRFRFPLPCCRNALGVGLPSSRWF
jgi:ABC-type amino acid transport system permease subunit